MQILEPSLRVAARGRFARENDGQTRYAAWGLRSTAVAGVSSITVFLFCFICGYEYTVPGMHIPSLYHC